jgi:hypothetical protein
MHNLKPRGGYMVCLQLETLALWQKTLAVAEVPLTRPRI